VLSVNLDPSVEQRLACLAHNAGQSTALYAKKIIEESVEDREDIEMAVRRVAQISQRSSLHDVKKRHALDS
jgi:predicted DNA-binding protein